MPELVDVSQAARELGLHPSRVRSLIADGALRADKVGGRWLVHWESVVARRREPMPPGRPLAARNVWTLLLEASGEPVPDDTDPMALWRMRKALQHQGLVAVRGRLDRRAQIHRFWALPGELRTLHGDDALVLTGSSAAGALHLELAAPDTIDAYLAAGQLQEVVHDYGLEDAAPSQSSVMLRAVPDEAWVLNGRRIAPRAAVALDLASYPDPRSARVGIGLLEQLDHGSRRA
jgi:excisionase family DNA binding protein